MGWREKTHLCVAARWAGKMDRVFASPIGERFLDAKTLQRPILGLGSPLGRLLETVLEMNLLRVYFVYRSLLCQLQVQFL